MVDFRYNWNLDSLNQYSTFHCFLFVEQVGFNAVQMEMCLNPDLIKKWKRMTKAEAKKAKKRGENYDPSTSLEVHFLRNLIVEFLEVCVVVGDLY